MLRRLPTSRFFSYTTLCRSRISFSDDSHCVRKILVRDQSQIRNWLEELGSYFHTVINNNGRSEEHTSELQLHSDLVCRLLLEKKKKRTRSNNLQSEVFIHH